MRGTAGEEANEIADDAIRAVGPLAAWPRLTAEIRRRCAVASLSTPSTASIRARISRQRWLAEYEAGGGVRLVVDQIRMPPLAETGAARPALTLVMLDPLRTIIGHSLDPSPTSGASVAARLLVAIDREHGAGPPVTVRLPALATGGWPRLRATLADAGVSVATPVDASTRLGREIDQLVGRRLGGLPLSRTISKSMRLPPFHDLVGLRAATEAAIRRHNLSHDGTTPEFSLRGFDRRATLDAFERAWRSRR